MKWVKVNDELPQIELVADGSMRESKEILFYVPNWPHGSCFQAGTLIDKDGKLQWNSQDNWFDLHQVTHWADIEPPQI